MIGDSSRLTAVDVLVSPWYRGRRRMIFVPHTSARWATSLVFVSVTSRTSRTAPKSSVNDDVACASVSSSASMSLELLTPTMDAAGVMFLMRFVTPVSPPTTAMSERMNVLDVVCLTSMYRHNTGTGLGLHGGHSGTHSVPVNEKHALVFKLLRSKLPSVHVYASPTAEDAAHPMRPNTSTTDICITL